MDNIRIDFTAPVGAVKPLHAVNNAPVYNFAADQRITNLEPWKAAGIPYGRTHDASFYATYGGEHTVDVNMIFTDFSRDPDDPDAYDFVLTDEYLDMMAAGGTECFYRLGSKIEHWQKKYNTLPPADFGKWARVCEHIIRHCNEGWANGHHRGIKYWEIWNEPDLDPDDSTHKRCWGGTAAEFYRLYDVTAKHLKACFPDLKIGGPACASVREEWWKGFFANVSTQPDFFSWHVYSATVEKIRDKIHMARKLLDDNGWQSTESILNEWNYVRSFRGEDWYYSLKQEKSLKGAAFIVATMCMAQYEPLDMLMYYDARPGGMNGMFCTDRVCEILKGYWPFYMFNHLYRLGEAVAVERGSADVWAAAARGADGQAVMLSYFNDDDASPAKEVRVELVNVANPNGVRVEYYLLDETHDCKLVREEIFTAEHFAAYLTMTLNSSYLIKITAL